MKLSTIASKGPLTYKHIFCQTMTSHESVTHTLDCPQLITTLVSNCPHAMVVIFGDDTLAINVNGTLFAVENAYHQFGPYGTGSQAKTLTADVWRYIHLALGHNGDTQSN